MLYTETKELQKYRASKRLWQGIPSIEVTKRGRIFLTFYSGGVKEEIGNYVIVIKSDDGGNHFSEPIVIVKASLRSMMMQPQQLSVSSTADPYLLPALPSCLHRQTSTVVW